MFKYLKTENNSCHPSEVITMLFNAGDEPHYEIPAGCIFNMVLGGNIEPEYNGNTALFLAITGKKQTETAYVKCLPILKDMVLEGPISPDEDADLFRVGSVCDLVAIENGKGTYITLNAGPLFVIVDDSRRNEGFVSIRKL